MSEIDLIELIDSCLCTTVRKASRVITRIYDAFLEPADINIKQLAILMTIDGMNTHIQKKEQDSFVGLNNITQRLQIEKSTLSRNLRVLEDRQLLVLFLNPASRKTKYVKITEKGRKLIFNAYAYWNDIQTRTKEKFGTENFYELIEALNNLNIALEVIESAM